jgi:hypothetical protein
MAVGCGTRECQAATLSSILYKILQLYHQEGSGVATLRLGLRVVIGPRRKNNVPGLQRLAHHAHRILVQPVQVGLLVQEPWRWTQPQGLCHVSTFYTTLVKKSQEGNGHPNCGEFPFHALRRISQVAVKSPL